MSLVDLWKSTPGQLQEKHVQQVIAFAGGGKLRDASPASNEFRAFLEQIPSDMLHRYADECLTGKFDDGGFALQDVVNEVGRRLGFGVEHGRYRGTSNAVGFDGLWSSTFGPQLVVEVKTSDAYRIDLDTIARYRRDLVEKGSVAVERSSILIVVGRKDTGDLEAQIRGSRHAWDIRLISLDALLRLHTIKESVESPKTDKQIRDLLVPREYTRVDGIIDLVFMAASESLDVPIDGDTCVAVGTADPQEQAAAKGVKKFTPVSFHQECATRISAELHVGLLRRSRAIFSSPDEETLVVCAISREYDEHGTPNYWYAFHPHQRERLESAERPYLALACGSPAKLLLIPYSEFAPLLDGLNVTQSENGVYWHIQVFSEHDELVLHPKKGCPKVTLTRFLLQVADGEQVSDAEAPSAAC